jgi:hypothetical protein
MVIQWFSPRGRRSAALGLVVGVRILTTPFDRRPFRVLAHPLRDVGLRRHGALLQRRVGGKDQVGLLARGWGQHGTYGDDQVYRIHAWHPEGYLAEQITRNSYGTARTRFHYPVKMLSSGKLIEAGLTFCLNKLFSETRC